MRKFTLKTEIVSADKSTKVVNKINTVYRKMAKTITRESKIANAAFTRFTKNVGIRSKKMMVGLNNLNARVNRFGRNIGKKLGTLGVAFGLTALIAGLGSVIDTFASFEQANANLSSVMATATQSELKSLNEDAKRLGATTAKTSTEVVGLQESFARLGFETPDILNMTESTIAGSIAMRGELSDTADMVGAMIKTFDQFESINAPEILDQLTKSTQASALNFEKLQTALPNVAGAANAARLPFNKMLALLGKLSDAGIDASASSTSLRNILLQSAKQGKGYEEILGDIVKNVDKLTPAMNEFGVRAAVPATILSQKLNETLALSADILDSEGAASEAAAKQLDTLKGSLTILGSAWEGFILSVEDGNGSISMFLKNTVRVATEMLSLASGTEKAKGELSEAELKIRRFAEIGLKMLKVIKWLTIGFIAFKTAMVIFTTVSKIAAAATWLFNSALLANPITWVVVGIMALVAGIVLLVKNWKNIVTWVKESDSWFAKIIRASLYPLILVFKLVKFSIQQTIKMFKNLINWVKTSDSGFAKFIRGSINVAVIVFKALGKAAKWVGDMFSKVWDWLKKIGSIALKPIKKVINFFSKKTQDELGVTATKEIKVSTTSTKEEKLASALEENNQIIAENNEAVNKNTMAANKEWTGRFKTSILKDANISETSSGLAQKEIATSAISNEENITNIQKDVISSSAPQSVVTQGRTKQKSSKPVNGTITVNVVDNTGGQFALQVEGTGVEVITTGNG